MNPDLAMYHIMAIHTEAKRKVSKVSRIHRLSLQCFVTIHNVVDLEIFHWISENFDLLAAQEERSGNHRQWESSSIDRECL